MLALRMPSAYQPRAAKRSDGRLPLLPPRPEAFRRLLRHVGADRARCGQGRPPRHPLPRRARPGRRRQAPGLPARPGQGWNCFGGTGLPSGDGSGSIQDSLNDANWVAAWAPGWGGNRLPQGTGVPLPAGSQIVMQVHYNLLNGRTPDRSRAVLTVAPAAAKLTPLQTMLLPAPVELPCAQGEQGRLCNRNEALFDLTGKYGSAGGVRARRAPDPLPRERREPARRERSPPVTGA